MKKKEKEHTIIKRVIAMLLVVSLLLSTLPASVLAAGGERLQAAVKTLEENAAPEPEVTPEPQEEPDTTEPETPEPETAVPETPEAETTEPETAVFEPTQPTPEAQAKEAEAKTPEADPAPEGEIMSVSNALTVAESPQTQDAEIGESVVLAAKIEAQNPDGVTYQWQCKEGGDPGIEVQSTDEALERKQNDLAMAESIDLTGITGDESEEAAKAVQEKENAIREAKTRPIQPDNEGWSDIPGANDTQLAVTLDSETAGAPLSYRLVARTADAAIATQAAMLRSPNTDFESGTGTQRDPYIIATDQQLSNLHKYEGTASQGKYWRLRPKQGKYLYTDLVPIGNQTKPFMGTLDGDGYYISSNAPGTSDARQTKYVPIPAYNKNGTEVTAYGCALFGFLEDATIVNLNMVCMSSENTSVEKIPGTNVAIAAGAHMAAAGENATIMNCYTYGRDEVSNNFLSGEYQIPFLWWKEKINVYRYALCGGMVACGEVGDGYTVRFTGKLANTHNAPNMFCTGGNTIKNFAQTGTVYPNTSLSKDYRPEFVKNVCSSKVVAIDMGIFFDFNKITPGSIEMPWLDWNHDLANLNDYVAKDETGILNYWNSEGRLIPEISTRGVLDFTVNDYIKTYDGSAQKAIVNCAWKETERGRDWDYSYKNDKGETVDDDSIKLPGTYLIDFEEINRDYHLGQVVSQPADPAENPNNARLIVNPIADKDAPVCSGITYTDADKATYQPDTWTDKDVTVTFNIDDFTKGGNYNTVCDTTSYTVDQEGNEVSGVGDNGVVIKDANGTKQNYTKDGNNYTVTLHVDEGKQLTTTLVATMTDKKGNASVQTTEPIKINKSAIKIEVTGQKDNDEQATILSGGSADAGYSFFAKNRIRFDVKAEMDDNSLYVDSIRYKFVPVGAVADDVLWETTDFTDHQNPHSINMTLENTFDGTLHINATSVNGKSVDVSYKVMLEEHQPSIISIAYTGYKGQGEGGSADSQPETAYKNGEIYHKVNLDISYQDPEAEKSGIARAQVYRADNNDLLAEKVISNTPGGQGELKSNVTLTCSQTGSYPVKVVLTDKAGNEYTKTGDTLNIEAAAPAVDIQWAAPVKDKIYDFGKWCDQNATVTLSTTNPADIVNKVDYYYRRAKRDTMINNEPWVKINTQPLSPTETLDYTITDDGKWHYQFKATTQANICGNAVDKNIYIDRSPLDTVTLTPQDVSTTDPADVQTEPNGSGWYTDADRALEVKMSLANNGESKITGKYKLTYKPTETAANEELVKEDTFSTDVGQTEQTITVDCKTKDTQGQQTEAKDGSYTFTVGSETDSGRGSVDKVYTYKVDRTLPSLDNSWFVDNSNNRQRLDGWKSQFYLFYKNQPGHLEINATDDTAGLDKIEYQICNDIAQDQPPAGGVWQEYNANNKPAFSPQFSGNVFIRVTDKAGHVVDPASGNANTHSSSFYLDNQKPQAEVTADKDLTKWQTDVTFSVKIKDAESGISLVKLVADNDVSITANDLENNKTDEYWKNLGIENLKTVKEPSGIYSEISFTYHSTSASANRKDPKILTLDVTDNSGNKADQIKKEYKIDAVAPSVNAEYTDIRKDGKWYNQTPSFKIENTKQAAKDTDKGADCTLSGVRYYYKTWKSGETAPADWTPINDTPTDKAVTYTYPDEAKANVQFRAVSETGAASETNAISVLVDRTNPENPTVAVKNKDNGDAPDGKNSWYSGAWPTIDITDPKCTDQQANESVFYKLYTGADGSKAQTATKGQSILNSSFNKDANSPNSGAPGIVKDNNGKKDNIAEVAAAAPADPTVMAEGARTYEEPEKKQSNELAKKEIHVLNLYPQLRGDVNDMKGKVLIKWMVELAGVVNDKNKMRIIEGDATKDYLKFEVTAEDTKEKITMTITQKSITDFNAATDPNAMLKKDGKYYDLIYLGAEDANGYQDIAAGTLTSIQNYMNAGNGFLVGHDAFSYQAPNIVKAMESLANITPGWTWTGDPQKPYIQDEDIYTPKGASYEKSKSAQVVKSGKITSFPFKVGNVGTNITVEETHDIYQFAKGDVWLQFSDGTNVKPYGVKTFKEETGTSNYYLTTSGNVGMSQVGHTAPTDATTGATNEEKKLLVNTMVTLAQKPTSQFVTTDGKPQEVTAIIRTQDQLKLIGNKAAGYPPDGLYVLGDNITIDGNFTPITGFCGSFDGGNYTITSSDGKALFASTTKEARIMNFNLHNSQLVSGTNAGQITNCASKNASKPLIGVENSGNIAYCSVAAGVLDNCGIVPNNSGVIQDCKVTGKITGRSAASQTGGIAEKSSGSIQNCEYSGTISRTDQHSYAYIGGIVGESTGALSRCKTEGSITTTQVMHSIGGIVGSYSKKALADCESAMNISVAQSTNVGGIVGRLADGGSLSSCKNSGNIDRQKVNYAGGIAGSMSNGTSLRNAVNTGSITGSSMGSDAAGGLAGMNLGSISDSKTSGAVAGAAIMGGAVGTNSGGSIVSCYAASTGITPAEKAAGFVGSHTNGGTINTCATTANSFVGTNYNSSANPKITADGVYTLETWVKDEATDINAQNQNTSGTVKNTIMVDTHGPAPFTATVENNVFTTLLNKLTFGLLFDKTTDVVLEASDDVSGMDSIEYKVYETTSENTNPETDPSTPVETKRVSGKDKVTFSITPNFQGYVRATATDKAGNTTELSTDGFRINSTLPRVKASAKKGNLDYNGDWSKDALTVTLEYVNKEGSNDLAGIFQKYQYSIDNGKNWADINTQDTTYFTASAVSGTTQTLTFSKPTSQSFIFRAAITNRTDSKTASETTAVNIKIDNTVPTVAEPALTGATKVTDVGGYAVYGAQPTLTVDAKDPEVSGLMDGTPNSQFASGLKSQKYKLESGGKDKDYTGPLAMKDGKYEFSFTATDNAGNVKTTTTQKFIVDTMVPNAPKTEAKIGIAGYDGSWTDKNVTIIANTQDTKTPLSGYNGNGIQYALYKDGELKQDWKDYNGTSVTIEALDNGTNDGSWSVCFKVVTNAGHESAQSVVNVNIQKTAPTMTVGVNGKYSINSGVVVWTNQPVTLEAATNGSTLYQKKGTGSYEVCKDTSDQSTTHQTVTVNTDGVTTYKFKGESKSKVTSESDVYKIALDQKTPDMPAMSFKKDGVDTTLEAATSSQWYQDNERNTLKITDPTKDTGDCSPRTLKYRVYKNDATVVPDYTKATGTTANINNTNITESGTWILEAYTEDAAGNASAVNRQVFNYTKSGNLPTIKIDYNKTAVTTLSDGTPVYKGAVTATITAADNLVGIKKDGLKFMLTPDNGTKLQYGTMTRYTGPVEIENFKGTITVEVTNNANQTATLTQRVCADSQKPSVSIRDADNKKERQWQKESFSLEVTGGHDTKSGFAKYQRYDTATNKWVDFIKSDRINDSLDYLWNNVKYDVTQNGKTLVRVRAVNNAGIEGDEATFEVWKDDTTAPITIDVKSTQVGNKGWSTSVEFTPKVDGDIPPSGVDYYYQTSDSPLWRKLTGTSLAIRQTTPEAGQAYTFKAVSGTGNESQPVTKTAYIDGEKPKAPQLTRSVEAPDGENGWYVTSPTITITEAAKASGQNTTGLDIDNQLRSEVETEYQLTAPQAQTAEQKSWLHSRAANTAVTPTWQTGDTITFNGSGSFDFMTRSKDAAANLSDFTKKETIKIDTADPTLNTGDITVKRVSDGGVLNNILYNDTVEVTAKAADVGSGVNQITYQLGNDETTKKTLTADGNGSVSFRLSPKQGTPLNTSLKLTATDLAGRGSAPVTVDNILLEVEKPEAKVSTTATPNAEGWYKGELPYTVEVSDKDAGLQSVKVTAVKDGSETVLKDVPITEADKKAVWKYEGKLQESSGAHFIKVTATDLAGNTQIIEKPFKLEAKAPDLGVNFTLMDTAGTTYTKATSYDVQAQLSYLDPVSGVEDLQVSADGGNTWSSVSDALGKKHKITTETNAEYRFRLVTNAGNVSNETVPQQIVISRKMPDPASIEVKDTNGQIMSGTWSNQDQTATISLPACSDAGVQAATEYQYRTIKDSMEDTSRKGSEAPKDAPQQIALADFTEEGAYTVKAWGQQKDSGLKDEANLCEAQVLVDKTPPEADKSNVNAAMDNGLLKANVYVFDSLSGGGSVDYTLTRSGVESPVQNASCSQMGEASIDIGDLAPGDKLTVKKLYDKAGNSADMTADNVVEIPKTIDFTKITVGITPQETTEEGWYHGAALSAQADISIEGGTRPEDIKDDAGNVVKAYPINNSLTKLEVTYPDNTVTTLDYTTPEKEGKLQEQLLIDNIKKEGKNLSFKVKAYDAWDNSAEAEWSYQNDATAPEKPEFKLTTSDGVVGTTGETDKEVTLTVSPDTQKENPDNPAIMQTSPLRDWQYSLDGGTSWSEAYPITDQPESLSRVIAGKGPMETDAIVVRVTDLAGNIGANSDAKSLHVTDTQAPVDLGITETDGASPVDSAWDCRKADRVLKVHATDPADGVISLGLKEWNYSLDNGNTWQADNIPWDETGENNITITDDGIYNVIFKVWDKAGNVSVLDKAAVVKKDLTAPVIEEQDILFEQKKGADNWIKAAIHWLSFGNFFNDSIRVTVPVTDALSGNHSVSFSVGDTTTEVVVNDGKAVFTIPVNAAKDQTLQVSAKDVAGNVSSTLPVTGKGNTAQWTVENSGPVIGDSVTDIPANAAGWYGKEVTVNIPVEDADSGLAAITWQLNNEPEQTVKPSENGRKDKETVEVKVTEDGVNTIKVAATDNAGNSENREYSFKLDNGKELTAYISETTGEPVDADRWRGGDTVSLKANMAVGVSDIATWEYTLDGGQTWTDPRAWGDENILEIKEDGVYCNRVDGQVVKNLIAIRVTDVAGHQTESPYESIKKDNEAPAFAAVRVDTPNGSQHETVHWYKEKNPGVGLSPAPEAEDKAPVTHTYELNGQKTVFETETELGALLQEGKNTIRVYAVDAAGNAAKEGERDYIETILYLDTKPSETGQPSFKNVGGSPLEKLIHWLSFGNFFNEAVQVTVPVSDATSGTKTLMYTIGEETKTVAIENNQAVFEMPMDTNAPVSFNTEDIAGNVSSPEALNGEGDTAQWMLENSGPMIADSVVLEDANAAGWYSEDVHVSVAVEDADSGLAAITWQLNDEPEQTVMPSENGRKDKETIEVTVTKDGVNTIRVTATDNAGNSETREYSFKLDHGMELQAYITETTGEPVDANRWRGGDTVSLKANMAAGQSGIATWEYTLDGGQTWTDPRAWGDENILEIKEDGVYCQSVDRQVVGNLIGIRVTDVAGNQTESPYESIKKDNEAPAFAAVYMDEANGNTHETVRWHKEGKPSVRLVPEMEPAKKAPVTHTCVLNDEPVVFDSEAELREMLREGENILRVYAKDAAGNEAKEGDQNYIERVLYIDTEMPEIGEVSFKDSGNNPLEKLIHWLSFGNFFNEAVQVTVPVTDTTSGCETLYYSLDGQTREISVKDGRASFEIPMDTNASLSCYAKDIAGNRSKTLSIGKESGKWVITDKIEIPDLWINGEAALGQWYNQPVSYELLVSCPEAGINSIEQTIDKGEPVILQEALFLESLIPEYRVTGELGDDGIHQLQHSITDHAGNQTQREDIIKIDQTAPKGLKITGAPQNGEILEPQTLTVWADDSIEGIDTSGLKEWSYTLDGGKTWTAPQLWNQNGQNDITVKDARAYDISFKVWDHAGNVSELSATESVRFTIASDNSFNVVNPVTGLYFTTVQLMGLAGCLIAVLATLLLSLAWRRKNRQK